jgi:hypothetical protein
MNLAPVPLFLVAFSGFCWTVVYLDSIRLGFKEATYAMPFWALALNIAWELQQAVLEYQAAGFVLQVGISAVWFLLDCVTPISGSGKNSFLKICRNIGSFPGLCLLSLRPSFCNTVF